MGDEKIEDLKKRIAQVLRHKKGSGVDYSNLSVEELIQQINVYYQELEFQNEEL
ncbi:hypothetical protein [Gracilinema caldarium]|uniref:hypothetical protein n=1 Tax=Gracilinema caldarium TaxID=215591 RepID=UPI0026F025DE|nr:hypothetical protein [Gracilinema caldarium]